MSNLINTLLTYNPKTQALTYNRDQNTFGFQNRMLLGVKRCVHHISGGRLFKDSVNQSEKGLVYRAVDAIANAAIQKFIDDRKDLSGVLQTRKLYGMTNDLKKIKSVFQTLQDKLSRTAFKERHKDENQPLVIDIPEECFSGPISTIDSTLYPSGAVSDTDTTYGNSGASTPQSLE